MTWFTFIWRNLWRCRVRTGLTIASVAVSLGLFTTLGAVVVSMASVADDSASQLRLVVHHKTTMTKLLPLSIGRQIAALPGVRAVCGVRWFGGRLADSSEQFPSLAADPQMFPVVYSDFELSEAEIDSWRRSRTAAVVGAGLAQRMGWERGQRVTLDSTVPPYLQLEFRVIGITPAAAYPNVFVLRLDYFLEALRADPTTSAEYDDAVYFFWVKAGAADDLGRLRREIDARFANSPHATRTEPEEAFIARFTKMLGDLPALINAVGLVVVATTLLVVGNTVSISVRERLGEFATLKALGYGSRQIVSLVVGEGGLLGLLGGLLGCVPAFALARQAARAELNVPYFPILSIPPSTVAVGVGAGILLGLIAALLPARHVARQPVSSVLRTVQ